MHMKTDIGKRIKKLREEKGLNQNEFAKIIKIGKATIIKYETGVSTPKIRMIIAVAKFFEVSTDYLLGLKEY